MKRIPGLSVGLVAVALTLAVVPARANVTIGGCAIVAHPSPNHHTDCPGDALGGADLGGANLSYANLARDNLVGANLGGANLSYANLSSANLTGSDLTPDNFSHANLAAADLGGDDLSGDSFHGANLARANLARANLAGSDLRCANLNGVDLAGANLGGAKRGCSSSRSHKPFPVQVCRPYSSRGFFDVRVRHMSCSLGRRILAGAHLGDKRSRVRGFACRQFSLSPQRVGFPYDVLCRKGPASVRAGVCDGPCGTSARALPKLLAGSFSGIRPRDVAFSAEAGNIVTNITWQHWNHTSGVGHGTSNILSCIPDCADGKATPVATSVMFSKPVRGHFTKVIEVRAGQTLVGHYPRPWPVEGVQAAGAAASCGRVTYHYRVSGMYGGAFYAEFAGLNFHNGIYVSGVGCAAARRFVRGFAAASLRHARYRTDWRPPPRYGGWRCAHHRAGDDVGTEMCRRGRSRIDFSYYVGGLT